MCDGLVDFMHNVARFFLYFMKIIVGCHGDGYDSKYSKSNDTDGKHRVQAETEGIFRSIWPSTELFLDDRKAQLLRGMWHGHVCGGHHLPCASPYITIIIANHTIIVYFDHAHTQKWIQTTYFAKVSPGAENGGRHAANPFPKELLLPNSDTKYSSGENSWSLIPSKD